MKVPVKDPFCEHVLALFGSSLSLVEQSLFDVNVSSM